MDTCNQKQQLSYHGLVSVPTGNDDERDEEYDDVQPWSLRSFLRNYYIPFITCGCTKFIVIVTCAVMLAASIVGIQNSTLGLELSDVLPENTAPAAFLKARDKYFSFYPMFIILDGSNINFPNQQHMIDNLRQDIGIFKAHTKT